MIKHELSIKQLNPVQEGFYRRRVRIAVVTLLLLVLTLILCGMMLYLGNTRYSLGEIVRVLWGE